MSQQNNKLLIISNKSENELIKNNKISNNNECSLNDINNYKNITSINNYKSDIILENQDNKKEINLNLNKNPKCTNLIANEPPNNSKLIWRKGNSKYIFPKYYYFLDVIFDHLIYPKKLICISKTYFIIYNFMCQVFDISTYIILYKHVNILSNMLKENSLENNRYKPSNFFNRINISDLNKIDRLHKDLKNRKSILYFNYFL